MESRGQRDAIWQPEGRLEVRGIPGPISLLNPGRRLEMKGGSSLLLLLLLKGSANWD